MILNCNKEFERYFFIRCNKSSGIITVRGRLIVVDFVGSPYPQIYDPTNIQQSNELSRKQSSMKLSPHEPAQF